MKAASIQAAFTLLEQANPTEFTEAETLPSLCQEGRLGLVAKWAFPLSGATGALIVSIDGWLSWKISVRLINAASLALTASDLAIIAEHARIVHAVMVRLETVILVTEAEGALCVGAVVEREQLWCPTGVGVEYAVAGVPWRLFAATAPSRTRDGEPIAPKTIAAYQTSDGFWQPSHFATIPPEHLRAKATVIARPQEL